MVDGETSKRKSSQKVIETELVHDKKYEHKSIDGEFEEGRKDRRRLDFGGDEIRINKNLETDFNTDLNDEENDKRGPVITVPEEIKMKTNKFLERINEEEEEDAEAANIPNMRNTSPRKKLESSKKKEECDVPSECEDFPSNAKKTNLDEKLSQKVKEMSFHSKNFLERKKIKKNITIGEFSTVTTKKGGSFKSSLSSNMKL